LTEWREELTNARTDWLTRGEDWTIEVAFANALLAVLDDQAPALSPDNPYADVVQGIIAAIEKYREENGGDAGE
jgi:hypothetical protein